MWKQVFTAVLGVAQAALLLSCVLGLSINHSTFICTRYNDPLTTSVAGNLKNVLMTAVGVFAFGDFFYHRWNSLGICISMAGAIWYATRTALRVSHPSILLLAPGNNLCSMGGACCFAVPSSPPTCLQNFQSIARKARHHEVERICIHYPAIH